MMKLGSNKGSFNMPNPNKLVKLDYNNILQHTQMYLIY